MKNEGTLVLTQSAIGEINFGDAAASDHRQRSEASGVKNEGTLFSLKVGLVKQIWRRSCKGPSATLGGVRCEQRRDSRAYSKCDW